MSKIYLLNDNIYKDVYNIEVFSIEYLKSNINLDKYDALVFTSKNAIHAIDSFNENWKKIPAYLIAKKTANIAKSYSGNIAFIGKTSYGDDFAKELINILQGKKVLYIRAFKTVSSLYTILKNKDIDIDELIAYKTICKQNDTLIENNSILIFTSPSSVECFFKNYVWNKSNKAIVIGKTTAKYFPKNIKYFISPKSSIKECIKLAKELLL